MMLTRSVVVVIRFFRGELLLGSAEAVDGEPIVEAAKRAGVDIPTNCTSGTCGTCLVRLKEGNVSYPEPLPPGLDAELVELDGILTCCMQPSGFCDIDIIPPL